MVRTFVSFGDRFEQPHELELIEAGIVKNRFDDRRLFPSSKQNVDSARDRSPLAAGFCKESHCANDCWKP
jgi:hypothetical protein